MSHYFADKENIYLASYEKSGLLIEVTEVAQHKGKAWLMFFPISFAIQDLPASRPEVTETIFFI